MPIDPGLAAIGAGFAVLGAGLGIGIIGGGRVGDAAMLNFYDVLEEESGIAVPLAKSEHIPVGESRTDGGPIDNKRPRPDGEARRHLHARRDPLPSI